jgi:hypothetical protein
MATVAAPHSESEGLGARVAHVRARIAGWLKWLFSSPLIVAIVAAALTATIVPLLTREWQRNEKQLALKSALATDMSESFTNAIGAGRRIGTGLVYAPTTDKAQNRAVIQGEYNRGLGEWQVDRGRLAAELFARYSGDLIDDGGKPIVIEWRSYARAVEQFYRLGAAIPQDVRESLEEGVHSYFASVRVQPWSQRLLGQSAWADLERKLTSLRDRPVRPGAKAGRTPLKVFYEQRAAFRRSYSTAAETLLLVGEQFVERLLELKPRV